MSMMTHVGPFAARPLQGTGILAAENREHRRSHAHDESRDHGAGGGEIHQPVLNRRQRSAFHNAGIAATHRMAEKEEGQLGSKSVRNIFAPAQADPKTQLRDERASSHKEIVFGVIDRVGTAVADAGQIALKVSSKPVPLRRDKYGIMDFAETCVAVMKVTRDVAAPLLKIPTSVGAFMKEGKLLEGGLDEEIGGIIQEIFGTQVGKKMDEGKATSIDVMTAIIGVANRTAGKWIGDLKERISDSLRRSEVRDQFAANKQTVDTLVDSSDRERVSETEVKDEFVSTDSGGVIPKGDGVLTHVLAHRYVEVLDSAMFRLSDNFGRPDAHRTLFDADGREQRIVQAERDLELREKIEAAARTRTIFSDGSYLKGKNT